MYSTRIINGHHLSVSPHLNPTDKSNPSPDVLPPDARRLWNESYGVADDYYQGAWDLADMAAWRAVKMEYPNGAGNWHPQRRNPTTPPESSMKVPDPGQMIVLGRALEYVTEEEPPRLDVYRFRNTRDAPLLLWSIEEKMLLILPQDRISNDLDPDLQGLGDAVQLYEDYNWGQDARGFTRHPVPPASVKPLGMGDSIVYRSGKGTDIRDSPPGVQEYIHQFGDGVVAYQGPSKNDPKVIVFKGGDLDVQGPGIIN